MLKYTKISKLKDPLIQEARNLSQSKFRRNTKKLLLYGIEQLQWAFENNLHIEHIFISDKELYSAYEEYQIPIYQVSEGILKKITGTNYVIPCVAVAHILEMDSTNNFTIVFDGVQDHGNIGTIIRTGSAYGINNYISTNESFDPFYSKIIDASRGTVFTSKFLKLPDSNETIQYLKKEGYQIIATSPKGKSLQSLLELEKKPIALILGNETNGISEEIINNADSLIQIPMSNSVESLNVGVAAGISIYELKMKEVITMLQEHIKKSIGRDISITLDTLKNSYNKKLQEVSNFNVDQIIFLMVLNSKENISKEDIKENFINGNDTLSVFLKSLFTNHLIVEHCNNISITQHGKEILTKLWPIHEQIENLAFKGFSKFEKESFINSLSRIKNNLIS
ncbi:TrmH family RNA methyltransferase [Bacillus cytotoxicus]